MTRQNVSRRQFLKIGGAGAAALAMSHYMRPMQALAAALSKKLSDPAIQPIFVETVPDALATTNPSFIYQESAPGVYTVGVGPTVQKTGLVDKAGLKLDTALYGYGQGGVYTWPGKTFEIFRGDNDGKTQVTWENNLFGVDKHLLPVDTSLHWAYALHGYEKLNFGNTGIPIITHVHGGHSDFQFDGNPEFFYSPGGAVVGPQWTNTAENGPISFTQDFVYDTNVPAACIWYHDHALGITRLNVYAGMAGFFIVRDEFDQGRFYNSAAPGNDLGLPKHPYEMALAIQDRMFKKDGALFYPAFPSDPAWADFITGEGLKNGDVPKPSALAEFFGDHMLVNGKIWPKADVDKAVYRLRLLNGCDSRFLVIQFRPVDAGATDNVTDPISAGTALDFSVIGADQGLGDESTVKTLVIEPGSRYDVLVDFSGLSAGDRVIMSNLGGDAPFGGDYGEDLALEDFFPDRRTDRIMAFDITNAIGPTPSYTGAPFTVNGSDRTREVALFEGKDEYGRLQPLLGTVGLATDWQGNAINWPSTEPYISAGLVGQMEGAIPWHSPTTENPALGETETWNIWNVTGDAHPVHLHLVKFQFVERQAIKWDTATDGRDDRVLDPSGVTAPMPNNDGTYLVTQPVVQHNGTLGTGFIIKTPDTVAYASDDTEYYEDAPLDVVTALPDTVTVIKANFDKWGRYVWHCHILSHEDHEMMRVLFVGEPGNPQP